jgi:hypothetical protein
MTNSVELPKHLSRTQKIIACTLVVLAVGLALSWSGWLLLPGQDRDRMLLQAVQSNNLTRFKLLLWAGANPNRVFGAKPEDWVMCEVAERGRLAFLKAAQAHGGNIHMRNTTPPIQVSLNAIYSAPLLCAIAMHNHETFSYLLQQGVDTTTPVFVGNPPGQPGINPALVGRDKRSTPLMEAIGGYEFRMAYDMMQLRPMTWDEKWRLAFFLRYPGGIDTNSEAYRVWLPKVLALARQQGLDEIDPDEPSPQAKQLGIPRSPSAPPPRQ